MSKLSWHEQIKLLLLLTAPLDPRVSCTFLLMLLMTSNSPTPQLLKLIPTGCQKELVLLLFSGA